MDSKREGNIFTLYMQTINRRRGQIPEDNLEKLIEEIGEICIHYLPDNIKRDYLYTDEYPREYIVKYTYTVITIISAIYSLRCTLRYSNDKVNDSIFFRNVANQLLGYNDESNMYVEIYNKIKEFRDKYHSNYYLNEVFIELENTLKNLTTYNF